MLVRLLCRQYKFEILLYVVRTNWKEKYQGNHIFVKNNVNLVRYRKHSKNLKNYNSVNYIYNFLHIGIRVIQDTKPKQHQIHQWTYI